MGPSVVIDDVEGITVLGHQPARAVALVAATQARDGPRRRRRVLIVLAPAMIAIALAVQADSRGPVFFRQRRVGRGGEPFRVVKFRTMSTTPRTRVEELRRRARTRTGCSWSTTRGSRRSGASCAMTSLDELPQLLNVLRGQMSLVGPRPLIEEEDRLVDGWGRSRADLTPGLTGFWQVLGRTSIPFDEMVKLDYLYVTNWSAVERRSPDPAHLAGGASRSAAPTDALTAHARRSSV